MKKTVKAILTAALVCAAMALTSCADAIVNDGTNVRSFVSAAKKALFVASDGYDISVWNCWNCDSTTGLVEELSEGGIRCKSYRDSSCGEGQNYFGVNLAAGSGNGATADIDGQGYTQVVLKVRGNVALDKFGLYAETSTGATGANAKPASNGGTEMDPASKFVQNAEDKTLYENGEWIELRITGFKSTDKMKSALMLSVFDPCSADAYVDIKGIDFQDADGNSVVPVYNR